MIAEDNIVYFKICYPTSLIVFYHDLLNDRLDGVMEECKSEDKLIIRKHPSSTCYDNVVNNSMAMAMVKKAKRISKEEYETACLVADSMLTNEWLLADNDYKRENKNVVTETVYV
jgi:hypothetical protein